MRIVDLEQGSKEWLAWRQGGLGSSDASILVNGEHFGRTPLDLWKEKTNQQARQVTVNAAMTRGKAYEPELRAWYERVMGVQALPLCCTHDEFDWLKASLDGFVALPHDVVLEIKYARREYHEQALAGEVPATYRPQLLHQLVVTGARRADYVSFNPRFPRGEHRTIVSFEATAGERKQLFDLEHRFWQCVRTQCVPSNF